MKCSSFRGLTFFTNIRFFHINCMYKLEPIYVIIKCNMSYSQAIDAKFNSSISSILWDLLFKTVSIFFQKQSILGHFYTFLPVGFQISKYSENKRGCGVIQQIAKCSTRKRNNEWIWRRFQESRRVTRSWFNHRGISLLYGLIIELLFI